MRRQVERAEEQVKAEREAIQQVAERQKDYRAGTQDYKSLEEELVKRQSDLAAKIQLQKKEFLQMEAKIYNTVYQEIQQEVEYYASSNNIAMVVRFNGDPVDVENPEDVLRSINSTVIWYNKAYDITPVILDSLNRTALNRGIGDQRSKAGVPMPAPRR
jgi:Skp family chaperone for outer membrane proteins